MVDVGFSALWSMLGDGKELLGRIYAVGVTCHLNIIHNKISENILSENFAQNCRPFQMLELPGNIRKNGSFKVTAECQTQLEPILAIRRISRSSLSSEHLAERKAAPSAFVTDGVFA